LKRSALLFAVLAVAAMLPATSVKAQATGPSGPAPCVNGKAAGFPCKRVDLLSFLPMSEMGGGRASDVWGWVDPETKREYALVGSTRGLLFVDVTNDAKPIYLGVMAGKADPALIWQDVEVYQDHAYVVCDLSPCGMQVFDLTQLRGVKEAQTWPPTFVYPVSMSTHSLDINTATGFAYLNGSYLNGGSHIADLANPGAPVPAGQIQDDGYTHDSHCRIYHGPDKRYKEKEICFNANEDTITTYDLTSKTSPVQLSRVTYKTAHYTHQAWLTEDHRYILVSDEGDETSLGTPGATYIFDVSNLEKPKQIGTYFAQTKAIDHNNYILGDVDYQASYTAGLRVLDLSNIATGRLKELGYFDVVPASDEAAFDGAWGVYPYLPSGNVLISGMGQGLFVVDPKD